jgi:flagellar hook-basal body complex protein FliE
MRMTSPTAAANAYAALARIADPSAGLARSVAELKNGPDFGALVKEALNVVNTAGRKSDAQTQALATGKANIVDVVTAVAETEVAVEALVSVRDRVINAYEEIMRMPI